MKLNKDTEYALISLIALAENDRVYSARVLSDQQNLPYGLICKIMQRLANAGLLKSIRGPKGGYKLAAAADEIPLSAIEGAIHERHTTVPCLDERSCEKSAGCTIRGGVVRLQSRWDELMTDITLADFMNANNEAKTGESIGYQS